MTAHVEDATQMRYVCDGFSFGSISHGGEPWISQLILDSPILRILRCMQTLINGV
jgi:hypothetical protein